jgi:predicted alpha/beta hydrolase family esterase
MHLIILPGNSKEFNEQWLYDSEEAYKDLFESTTTHVYESWKTGDEIADVKVEADKLTKEAEKLEGDYVILAKSIGTIATVTAIGLGQISPKKCIFVGCPWGSFSERQGEFESLISKFKVPTLFIQQTDDMFFKYAELEKVIKEAGLENYNLIEIEGNNHAYDNYDKIKQMVKEFLLA